MHEWQNIISAKGIYLYELYYAQTCPDQANGGTLPIAFPISALLFNFNRYFNRWCLTKVRVLRRLAVTTRSVSELWEVVIRLYWRNEVVWEQLNKRVLRCIILCKTNNKACKAVGWWCCLFYMYHLLNFLLCAVCPPNLLFAEYFFRDHSERSMFNVGSMLVTDHVHREICMTNYDPSWISAGSF